MEILSTANIRSTVFNQSIELFLIAQTDNALIKSSKLSLYSPFLTKDTMSETVAKDLL